MNATRMSLCATQGSSQSVAAVTFPCRSPGTPMLRKRSQCRPLRQGKLRVATITAAVTAAPPVAPARMPKWHVISSYLRNSDRGLRSVSPVEAEKLVASGEYVLVDVRPAAKHQAARPKGAISAPMYQVPDYSKPDLTRLVRAAALALNGVQPVEANPDFARQLRAATAGGKGVIVMCEAGGTLRASDNFPLGKPSRSLQAAYRVYNEGLAAKVVHMDGGVYGWYKAELPFDGKYDASDVGRTPNAATGPKGSLFNGLGKDK